MKCAGEIAETTETEVTDLLNRWGEDGRPEALREVFPKLYLTMRRIASRLIAMESGSNTYQTTALVNDAYLEFSKSKGVSFQSRRQFQYFAGQVMRHILVEHARKRLAAKRGGGVEPLSYDETINLPVGRAIDLPTLIALDEAMKRLQATDLRLCQIVELRFFMGLNSREIAEALGVSERTVSRDWDEAKRRLQVELSSGLFRRQVSS